jgi:hypothetical protein
MDGKDWLLVVAAIVIFGGPVTHALWKRSRGPVTRNAAGDLLITDTVRLGTAVAEFGGRALAEGAKQLQMGALRYNDMVAARENQLVGGS